MRYSHISSSTSFTKDLIHTELGYINTILNLPEEKSKYIKYIEDNPGFLNDIENCYAQVKTMDSTLTETVLNLRKMLMEIILYD